MNGSQQRHSAVGCRCHSRQILRRRDLIHGDDLRIGGAHQHRNAQRLGTAVQHVRVKSHIQLRYAPVVHDAHTQRRSLLAAVGQRCHHLPQQCGLARPRRCGDQRALKRFPLRQQLGHIPAQPCCLAADAYRGRRDVPQVHAHAIPQHHRTAQPYTKAAPAHQIPFSHGLGRGVA